MIKDLKDVVLDSKERKLLEKGWGIEVTNDIKIQKFFYKSDSENVSGYLAYPLNFEGKLPIIIWNRGGNYKNGLLDDFLASGILGEIASWNYIVFASQYRKKDEFGGKDINDVLNLIELAKSYELSDEHNIGMEGWSRGGMMTYLSLRKSNEIKCCVIIAGLSNLFRNAKNFSKLEDLFNFHFGDVNENIFNNRMEERSAVYWAEKISPKTNILFIHGRADEKILYEDSVEMYEKLSKINVNTKYELELIYDGDHYLRKYRKKVSQIRRNWFDKFLK